MDKGLLQRPVDAGDAMFTLRLPACRIPKHFDSPFETAA
jgi:hypothetical protein